MSDFTKISAILVGLVAGFAYLFLACLWLLGVTP